MNEELETCYNIPCYEVQPLTTFQPDHVAELESKLTKVEADRVRLISMLKEYADSSECHIYISKGKAIYLKNILSEMEAR